jgi:hypothetical protein
MAAQYNSGIPILTNQIANDIPDIQETLEFFKDLFTNFGNTWSNTVSTGFFPKEIARVAKTGDYTVTGADTYISASGNGSTVTITLEASATATAGRIVIVKATDITNQVDIDGDGAETIDGATTFTFSAANEVIALISDASNWEVLYHDVPVTLDATEKTISTGAITITQPGYYTVDTESDAASDDLDSIGSLPIGAEVTLRPANTARTVVVKNDGDNLVLASSIDFTMNNQYDCITLVGYATGKAFEKSRSNNGS